MSKLRSLILEPNPLICLIGPDGVGKSSVSEGLVEHLTKSNFFRKVKIFHHRFDYVPQLGKFNFKKNKTSLKYNMVNSRIHRPLRTTIYLFYYSIDYLFGWLEILKSKFRDEIIIMDRYFYDFYIQNSYSRVSDSFKNLFHFFIPKPSVTIFLYANPRIVVRRKKELTLDQHIIQNKRCIYVLRNLASNPIFINCVETPKISAKYALKMIIKRIYL